MLINEKNESEDLFHVKIIDFGTSATFHREDINHMLFDTPK